MAAPPVPKGLDRRVDRVANRLHSAAIHLLRHARQADRETGLTPARLSLLSVLVYVGPRTMSELARVEQVSLPAITRSVSLLEGEGLVRRVRSDEDRRVVTVHATAMGRRLMERGRRRRIERIGAGLEGLEAEELRQLESAVAILERAESVGSSA